MRGRPDIREKRIDLNVPQVAGGAVAAVVAAKLASYFGVYGTILGAGLVSVIATCGGSVFQHFFRRTGEQLREATVTSRTETPEQPLPPGEFTEGTVYRARVRSWKRPLLAAALVFGVTMAGITTYELVSGGSFSGGKGTTVSGAVTGRDSSSTSSNSGDDTPASTSSGTPSTTADDSAAPSGGASSDSTTTSSPTPTPSDSADSATPSATPTGSDATSPTPSASSRSGTDDQDQADPAAR
ncbi:hypothetical protein [Streptomyces sp. S3(2020)]|uniref:hypothetical protein n=1 Tax=Streptomyces sp. S3(2020) TaxID=2732044 RepID=UPI001F0FBEDC|nr:hypothetical protein [Streptomyces sp. S3(2020)]